MPEVKRRNKGTTVPTFSMSIIKLTAYLLCYNMRNMLDIASKKASRQARRQDCRPIKWLRQLCRQARHEVVGRRWQSGKQAGKERSLESSWGMQAEGYL
jgi:hypothetical protein